MHKNILVSVFLDIQSYFYLSLLGSTSFFPPFSGRNHPHPAVLSAGSVSVGRVGRVCHPHASPDEDSQCHVQAPEEDHGEFSPMGEGQEDYLL